jgi:hypothetical protein
MEFDFYNLAGESEETSIMLQVLSISAEASL